MTLTHIAGMLGLDEVEAVRPIPLRDSEVGPVPPRPRNRAQRRVENRSERQPRTDRPTKKLRQGV